MGERVQRMCHICGDMGFEPCLKGESFMMGWERRL